MALLLPPLAGRQVRLAPLDLASERHGGTPDLGEGPPPLDPAVDVEAAGPRCLRPADEADIFEDLPGRKGDLADLLPPHTGHRVQVHAQLVRMIEIIRPDRMRVEVDAAEVDDPGKGGVVAHNDLVGCPTRREPQLDGVDPGWAGLRRALLEEELALGSVDEPLQRHRSTRHTAQRTVRDGDVVANQIGLGVAGVRKEHLLRVADRDLLAGQLQHLGRSWGHGRTIRPTSASCHGLSMPMSSVGALCRCSGARHSCAEAGSVRPSWASCPRSSRQAQCSASLPSATRYMCMCWTENDRPVAGTPM